MANTELRERIREASLYFFGMDFTDEKHREGVTELKELWQIEATQSEVDKAYGKGSLDTLEHVKKWADSTEITYNDMMKNRLAQLTKTEVQDE